MKLGPDISAVITGGASGLGAATARRLASQGAKVALFDLNAELGEALAKEIGGVFCRVDVTSEVEVDAGFERARKQQGQERILVNCAGTGNAIKTASIDKSTGLPRHYPLPEFERIIQINLIGSFRCMAKSAAGMLSLPPLASSEEGERGAIVNTASVAAQDGQAGQAAYAASKAGIVGLTLTVARDLMNDGIRVNTIMPGIFDTPLLRTAPEHVRAALAASVPFPKRLGRPEEFAAVAEMLITTTYMNGEALRLDGAIRMAPR